MDCEQCRSHAYAESLNLYSNSLCREEVSKFMDKYDETYSDKAYRVFQNRQKDARHEAALSLARLS